MNQPNTQTHRRLLGYKNEVHCKKYGLGTVCPIAMAVADVQKLLRSTLVEACRLSASA